MKRLALILSILALTAAGAVWSLFWLAECTEHVAEELQEISILSGQDPDAALARMETLQEYWDQSEPKIGLFVHEELLLEMSEKLEECAVLLRRGQDEEFRLHAELAAYAAKNLLHQQLPTLENILFCPILPSRFL